MSTAREGRRKQEKGLRSHLGQKGSLDANPSHCPGHARSRVIVHDRPCIHVSGCTYWEILHEPPGGELAGLRAESQVGFAFCDLRPTIALLLSELQHPAAVGVVRAVSIGWLAV